MAGAGRRSVERVRGEAAPCFRGKPGVGRPDGDGSPEARPVLGYILKGYPRISETFISNEILLLEQLGFSLSLFSMRQPREGFTHRSVKEIKARATYLPEKLIPHLPRLLYHNSLLARCCPDGYRRAFRLMVRRLRRSRTSATFRHLLQAGYLVHALLPGTGVGHLHAHFAHSPTSVALFASELSGLPFSFTAHAKDIYISDPAQLREKAQFARFVVTCTERNRQYLAELAPPTTPMHCIYHGINVELFIGTATERQPTPPFRILTVARLVEKKGLPTVFRALRLLLDQGHPIRYCLIGDGEDRRAILKLTERLGVGRVTEWLGTQPHEVVLEEYRKADLFVLGCQVARDGDRDGLPNVFLESMAMGVPVVATKVWAIPELVEDGRSGLLVPPEEPQAMAAAMGRLLTDISLRRQIIAGAHDRVRSEFDNRRLIGKLGALFEGAGVKRETPHARADT
jgi:glycosyltransferase involved in cell wall biosynthesis